MWWQELCSVKICKGVAVTFFVIWSFLKKQAAFRWPLDFFYRCHRYVVTFSSSLARKSIKKQFYYSRREIEKKQSAISIPFIHSVCAFWDASLKRNTVQKLKYSIKDFFNKCNQIRKKLGIWSHFLKKSLTENLIFVQWISQSA